MDEEDVSRIRSADWIFNALWTSCGDETIPRFDDEFYDLIIVI